MHNSGYDIKNWGSREIAGPSPLPLQFVGLFRLQLPSINSSGYFLDLEADTMFDHSYRVLSSERDVGRFPLEGFTP